MNLKQLETALLALFKADITPCLIGDRGVGKTESVRQFALKHGYHLAEFRAGQASDGGDLTGLGSVQVTEQGVTKTVFALPNFLASIQKRPKTILFLDEFNRADRSILQYLFELVYEKRIGINDFALGEDSHVILSGNPNVKGMTVTNFEDFAFADRVCQLKVENNPAAWYEYCKAKADLDHSVLDFFRNNSSLIDAKSVSFDIKAYPSYRSAERLAKLRTLAPDGDVFFQLAAGMIGTEATVMYLDWIKTQEVVTFKQVMNDFSKVEDKIKQYASGDRLDLINKINGDIIVELENMGHAERILSKEQHRNLVSYMLCLSPDTLEGFFRQVITQWQAVRSHLLTEEEEKWDGMSYNEDHMLTSERLMMRFQDIHGKKMSLDQLNKLIG